ncbi:MAG: hypothetical protein ACRDRH_19955 [Pseudonocardia sp.]
MAKHAWALMRCSRSAGPMIAQFTSDEGTWALAETTPAEEPPPGPGGQETGIEGRFSIGAGYRGCAGCGNPSFALCGGCSTLTCWAGQGQVLCRTCGRRTDVTTLIAGVSVQDLG